jgi:hypothetical protein
MQILLYTKMKLNLFEKVSSYNGRITLSGDRLEDNIKMNFKETQCLDLDWTKLSWNGSCVQGNKTATLM